jgi:tryptophan-rich sensory protein
VWFTLYLVISIAIWLIWINPKKTNKIIYIYFIHLFVNGSWSLFFFGLHLILVSLIIIAIIIFLAAWLTKLYYPINKISSYLMFPYIAWLSYAFLLNFYIFILN